jgi:tetratricopeptide (TPR) repeat protein
LGNLASAYKAAGKLDLAVPLYEDTLRLTKTKLGADHPFTLRGMNNLAHTYHAAGKLDLAVPLYEETLRLEKEKLGAYHPRTLTTLDNLAGAYRDAKRLAEAIALFEQVRDARVKKLGADHPNTLATLTNLAVAYREAGRFPEAIALLEQAAVGVEKRRFQQELAGRIIGQIVSTYTTAGQLDKAEGWQRKRAAFVKERAGATSADYGSELANLGLNLLQQKKWTEADPVLRECLAIRDKVQPDDWRTFNTQSMLGGALVGQRKYADAEPLLLKGYDGMKARERTIPQSGGGELRIAAALDRLIELYTATDKPEEVKKWRAERAKYPTVAPPPREGK